MFLYSADIWCFPQLRNQLRRYRRNRTWNCVAHGHNMFFYTHS